MNIIEILPNVLHPSFILLLTCIYDDPLVAVGTYSLNITSVQSQLLNNAKLLFSVSGLIFPNPRDYVIWSNATCNIVGDVAIFHQCLVRVVLTSLFSVIFPVGWHQFVQNRVFWPVDTGTKYKTTTFQLRYQGTLISSNSLLERRCLFVFLQYVYNFLTLEIVTVGWIGKDVCYGCRSRWWELYLGGKRKAGVVNTFRAHLVWPLLDFFPETTDIWNGNRRSLSTCECCFRDPRGAHGK